jgi:TolB-like protein
MDATAGVGLSAPFRTRASRSVVAVGLAMLIAALGFSLYRERTPITSVAPDKSIAVLPFENLSDNKDHPDFGAGVQDDLLTNLAQIHDLKVISRTSVTAYHKLDGRNIAEIGRALGVANVVEGSVRHAGNRVLVNVQAD